jgi:adenosine kinase
VIETVGTQEFELERRVFIERLANAYGQEAATEVGNHLLA